MFRNFILKHDHKILRLLEILPGFISWNLILLPYWGIFFFPNAIAYMILFFNIYWFYQSFQIAITATLSHLRIQAAMIYDWVSDVKKFPNHTKVHQAIIIPTYKEPVHVLERTIKSIADQTLSLSQISIVLAMEAKEDEKDRLEKVSILKKKFGKKFGNFFVTVHTLVEGEMAGKASNERHAAIWAKDELIKKQKMDINDIIITSCDADHVYHKNHFACLTYKFLENPKRHLYFWQPAVMFYNNIYKLPALTRVPNTLASIWNLSQLPRIDRLINQQNYSLSLKLLDDVGYWDPDKIPEDWGIFFKAFYKKEGKVEVSPIYLPLFADAVESTSTWKTFTAQYQQIKRWAWGVSDTPWIIKSYFLTPNVPFINKTMRLLHVTWSHFLWPVNWFFITIGLTVSTLINPAFGRTALGYTVPKISSAILTLALGFLVIMLVFDRFYKPKRPKEFPLWRALLMPFEFVLMPISGLVFSALPGLDAHTRLMMGKYIQYKVTEKV